jgi:hypothetical protein
MSPSGGLITVNASGVPTVTSITPSSGTRPSVGSTDVTVTINGTHLCGVQLSSTWNQQPWQGLTFSVNNDNASAGHSVTATFTIASNAWTGVAPIKVTTPGGFTIFNFTINPAAGQVPAITGLSPSSGVQGTSPAVTLTGANLSGASLSTSWNGLSFSNVSSTPPGTTLTATFNIAAGATVGNPPIQVTNAAGSTTTQLFAIVPPAPSITGASPSSGVQGTSVVVTLTGSNLSGANLSTAWSGLTFSNVASNSGQILATFNVAAAAALGTPTIQVTTAGGSTTTQLFTIRLPFLSKEYIHMGDRILAVETPP